MLKMASTAVLARLLTPEDYGIVGMTAVVTGFIHLFQDIGLSEATIQSPSVNHKQVSTLFWINGALGLGLALLTILIAPVIAAFYSEPRVTGVMVALSGNFLISSLGVQHQALLKRQMKFKAIAWITVISMAFGTIIGIVAAFMGAKYWALVVMFLGQSASYTVGSWMTCGWKPGWPHRYSGVNKMLRFGGNVTGFQTVNYFSRNLDNILIGRVWGSSALGLYSKAYQLLLLPIVQINTPVTSVAMPVLSRLQDDPEKYKRYYFKAISLITSVGMPIVCFLFATADKIVLLMLGDQWGEAIPIFRFLAPAALVGTYNVAPGWAYRTLGRVDRQFREGLITSFINLLIFAFSVPYGVLAVAAAYGLSRPFMSVFVISYCYRGTFLTGKDLIESICRPLASSVIAGIITFAIGKHFSNELLILKIAVLAIAFTGSYFLIMLLVPGGKKNLLDTLSLLKESKINK